jgi:hypothetical protein
MIHSRFFVLCLKQKIILALFLIFWLSILEGWVLLTGMELIFHLWQKLAIHDQKGKIFYLMHFMCFVWMSWMRIIPKRNLGPCPQHFSWFQIDILARNEMIQGSSWSHYTCLQVTFDPKFKRTWLQEMWWSKVWFQSEMRVRNVMIQLHCGSVVMCKDFQHDENATAKPLWLFQCCFVAIELSYKRCCNKAAYLCNTKVWKCFLSLGFQNHYKIYGTLILVFLSEQQLITVQELHCLAPPSSSPTKFSFRIKNTRRRRKNPQTTFDFCTCNKTQELISEL